MSNFYIRRYGSEDYGAVCELNATEALLGNEPARRLYESFGFEVQTISEGVMAGNEAFAAKGYTMRRFVPKSK